LLTDDQAIDSVQRHADFDVVHAQGKPVMVAVPPLPNIEGAQGWLTERRPALRALMHEHGHVYLRGLPIATSDDFAAVRDVLLDERASYKEKATPRSNYGKDIYSSTDLPSIQSIRLHNENSYTLDFPGVLAFCCIEAPSSGGATTIADVRDVLRAIPETLTRSFRERGWRLVRNYNGHVSLPWTAAFATDDRSEVLTYCERNRISAQWIGAEGLRTVQRRPAIIRHPVTGEEVWFNHVAFWNSASLEDDVREVLTDTYGVDGLPFETMFGDGTVLSVDEVRQLNNAYDSVTRRESWRQGDVMLVDNILCAHGRDAYAGARRVLVAMGEPVRLADCHPSPAPACN
jgi:alpha-ketoglutarate-dependent taurine dioxygenase